MEKAILAIAFALTVSFALVSGVMAQQQSSPSALLSAPAQMEKYSGVIERTYDALRKIVVKNGGEEKAFFCGDQTKVMQGNKEMAFTGLKKGDHVTIQYRKEGDRLTAERVEVGMEKTAKKASSEKSY